MAASAGTSAAATAAVPAVFGLAAFALKVNQHLAPANRATARVFLGLEFVSAFSA
jgi:hypothetical protein